MEGRGDSIPHTKNSSGWHYSMTSLFVWTTWVLLLVAALIFVSQYGSNVPSWDGWDMVPTLTGEQPVTLDWLWSQHNEHRIPLPRFILLGLHKITGINFLTPMYFNVLILGVLSFLMIQVSMRVREEASYTDAFFPLLLLHGGHAVNLLWGWQVQFTSSVALAIVVLLVIVQSNSRSKLATVFLTGICILSLPLTGANGLALVPFLALWLLYLAFLIWRSGEMNSRRDSFLTVCIALSALLLVGFYLIGYEKVPGHPTSSGLRLTVSTCIKFLTIGFGPAMKDFWPFSGWFVLFLLFITGAVLVVRWYKQPQERHRAIGLMCFFGAIGSLALAIGMGRDGFEPRYVILAAPVWCGVYFAWTIYGKPLMDLLMRMLLFLAACLSFWPNTHFGLSYAKDLRHQLSAFEHDMVAGVPSPLLINRHWRYLHINQDLLTDYLPMLNNAGVGKFRFLKENLPIQEFQVLLKPIDLYGVEWKNDVAYGTGRNNPYLVFALPEDTYVYGIRLKYSYFNEDGIAHCRFISWKKSGQDKFINNQQLKWCPTGDRANWLYGTWKKTKELEPFMTAWIFDTVKEVMINPEFKTKEWVEKHGPQHFTFKLSELVLLLPANSNPAETDPFAKLP